MTLQNKNRHLSCLLHPDSFTFWALYILRTFPENILTYLKSKFGFIILEYLTYWKDVIGPLGVLTTVMGRRPIPLGDPWIYSPNATTSKRDEIPSSQRSVMAQQGFTATPFFVLGEVARLLILCVWDKKPDYIFVITQLYTYLWHSPQGVLIPFQRQIHLMLLSEVRIIKGHQQKVFCLLRLSALKIGSSCEGSCDKISESPG